MANPGGRCAVSGGAAGRQPAPATSNALIFTTNVGDTVTAGPDHPLIVEYRVPGGEPSPYIHVRGRLRALLAGRYSWNWSNSARNGAPRKDASTGCGARDSFSASVSWTRDLNREDSRASFLLSLLRTIVLLPSCTLVLLVRLLKWLIAPPALLLQMLLGVPLVLLRVRQPIRPRFIRLSEDELPNAAWIALTDAAEALAADGFVQLGDFRCDELIQDAGAVAAAAGPTGSEHGRNDRARRN